MSYKYWDVKYVLLTGDTTSDLISACWRMNSQAKMFAEEVVKSRCASSIACLVILVRFSKDESSAQTNIL